MTDDKGPKRLLESELRVWKPGNEDSDPYVVAPGDHEEHGVMSLSVSPRINADVDQGSVELVNADGYYGVNQNPITRGDKVEWWVRLEGESQLSNRWTGMVTETEYQTVAKTVSYLNLDVEDFVFSVLADRIVYRVFENELITDIITQLIDLKAPEVSTNLPNIDDRTSIVANGLNLLEVIESLALRAGCVLYSRGDTLVMEDVETLTPEFTITPDSKDISYPGKTRTNPDDLVNVVRVDGGNGNALDDAQETQDSFTTVTESSRLTYRLSPTRSRADRIELYTRKTGSEESINVRIQRDDGAAPVDVSSNSKDIVNAELQYDDGRFEDGGWSVFFLDDHVFHDQNPWLIIESSGQDGQEVGVDSNGNPTFRSYYRYPIIAEEIDSESESEYRRIERSKSDESIRTFPEATETALTTLEHNNEPRKEFEVDAQSTRLQNLGIGDVVTLDFPRVGAVGDYILTERSDDYAQGNVHWTVSTTFQEVSSL